MQPTLKHNHARYDGDGNRVQKSNGKIYWYGAGTEILDETDLTGSTTNTSFSEYVFFGGKRIARLDASGNMYYYAEDMLGSSRTIVSVASGQTTGTLCYDADFYPFGAEHQVVNTCPQNYKFEGKERDTETNNDDFGARYYSSVYGRWLSADWSAVPAPVPYANLTNPQTLNLYAMVSDNPETFADLDGHDPNGPGQPGGANPPQQQNTSCLVGGGQGPCPNPPAPAQEQTVITGSGQATVNLGGIQVNIQWSTYVDQHVDQNGNVTVNGRGVEISATPVGCDNCQWAQTVSGTGIQGTKADTQPGANPKQFPFTGGTEHPGEMYDRPERSQAPAKLSFVSTMGVSDGKTFQPKGSITWGFNVDSKGSVTFSGVQQATATQQARSLASWGAATGMGVGP